MTVQAKNLLDLPSELFIKHIFPNLSDAARCKLGAVCSSFRQLAQDSLHWKEYCRNHSISHEEHCEKHAIPLEEREVYYYKLARSREMMLSNHYSERALDSYREYVNDMTKWGEKLVTASADKTVQIRNLKKDTSTVLKGHGKAVLCVGVSSERIVSGSADSTIIVWDPRAKKKKQVAQLKTGKNNPVTALKVKPEDEGKIYLAAVNIGVQEWDLNTEKCVTTFPGNRRFTYQIDVQDNLLAQASKDATVALWDVRAQKPFLRPISSDNQVMTTQLIGHKLVSGLLMGGLEIRPLSKLNEPEIKTPLSKGINNPDDVRGSLTMIKTDGLFIYTVEDYNRRVFLWNPHTGDPVGKLDPWPETKIKASKKKKTERIRKFCLVVDEETIYAAPITGGVTIRTYGKSLAKKVTLKA